MTKKYEGTKILFYDIETFPYRERSRLIEGLTQRVAVDVFHDEVVGSPFKSMVNPPNDRR